MENNSASVPTDNNVPQKFIILGGGAAGILLAMKLASEKRILNIDITLVDCKSFFEYTPSLISVLYEGTDEQFERHFSKATADYKTLLGRLGVKFELGILLNMDTEYVTLDGDGATNQHRKIPYDIAVICTGSSYHSPWKVSIQEQPTTTIEWKDRLNYLRTQREEYKASKNILCIGGGPVGVEVVTEIAYRSSKKKITLVNSAEKVLSGTPRGISESGERVLHHLDPIQLINGEKAECMDDHTYKTSKTNTEIKTDLVYNCTGVRPNTQFLQKSHLDWLDEKQHIRVNEFFQVQENNNRVFAIGDVNNANEPKLWFTAHMQTVHLYHNLKRLLSSPSLDMIPYHGSQLSMVISLGPNYAVGSLNDGVVLLNGWPLGRNKGSKMASIAKHTIERITMNDFHSKKLTNNILYNTHEKGQLLPRILSKVSTCSDQQTD